MKSKTNARCKAGRKEKSEVIVEKNDGLLWGRVKISGQLFTPYGETIDKNY